MNQFRPTPKLADVLTRCEIELPESQIDGIQRYCESLWEINQQLNLTRHTDYERFVQRDVVDTLQLSLLLRSGSKVLDVGTGGGVPGLVLAIIRPDLRVELCESIGKKARAVQSIAERLGLPVLVHPARVEQVLADHRFDVLVARAIGPLWRILKWVRPYWDRFDQLLLVKGPRWIQERGEARHRGMLRNLALRRESSYGMPGRHNQSVILSVGKKPK